MRTPQPMARSTRLTRVRLGRRAELVAVALLRLFGYRILARRHKNPFGEIDIIAARRGRVAFVEVKARSTFEDCEAAIRPSLGPRVRRAASLWLQRNPRYQHHRQGYDVIFVVPWRPPRHIPDGL